MSSRYFWLFKCQCGNEFYIRLDNAGSKKPVVNDCPFCDNFKIVEDRKIYYSLSSPCTSWAPPHHARDDSH